MALSAWKLNESIALMGSDRISYHFATRRVSMFSFNLLSPIAVIASYKDARVSSPISSMDHLAFNSDNPNKDSHKVLNPSHALLKMLQFCAPSFGSSGNDTRSDNGIFVDVKPTERSKTLEEAISESLARYAKVGDVESSGNSSATGINYVPLHYNFVIALLNDVYGIQGRGGCSCAGPYGYDLFDWSSLDEETDDRLKILALSLSAVKPGWARVNLNYFIDKAEATFIIEAVKQIAEHGWKLLPLYAQDLKTGQFFHRSLLGTKKKSVQPPYSINDIISTTKHSGFLGTGSGKSKISFPKPKCLTGERNRESYE